MPRPTRIRMALVVVGATLAILVFLFLQVALPFVLGVGGLVAVVVLDLGLLLLFRHRRSVRRTAQGKRPRPTRIIWGPVDRRYVTRRRDALQMEVAATVLVTVVFFLLYVLSVAVRVDAWIHLDASLEIVGGVMALATLPVLEGLLFGGPLWMWFRPSSEIYDTTDDH